MSALVPAIASCRLNRGNAWALEDVAFFTAIWVKESLDYVGGWLCEKALAADFKLPSNSPRQFS